MIMNIADVEKFVVQISISMDEEEPYKSLQMKKKLDLQQHFLLGNGEKCFTSP